MVGGWVSGRAGNGGGGEFWCYSITAIIAWRRATVSAVSCFIHSWLMGRRREVNIFARQHQNTIPKQKGELNRIQTSCRVSLSGHLTTADPDLHLRWFILLFMLAVHQGLGIGHSCTGTIYNVCITRAICKGGTCSEFLFLSVCPSLLQTQHNRDCLSGNFYLKNTTDIE